MWESCLPGPGSGKLHTGTFPAYALPLIAALSHCSFLMIDNQINPSLGLRILSSLPTVHNDKDSSGATVIAKLQKKRIFAPQLSSNHSIHALNSWVVLL